MNFKQVFDIGIIKFLKNPEEDLTLKKTIFWIIVFSIIFLLVYIINLWEFPFPSKPSDWGVFGDYIGGTIGTLIALASAIVLYKLSIVAKLFQAEIVERQLEHQSKSLALEFKQSLLKDVKDEYNLFFKETREYRLRKQFSLLKEYIIVQRMHVVSFKECYQNYIVAKGFSDIISDLLIKLKQFEEKPEDDEIHEKVLIAYFELLKILRAEIKFSK